MKISRRVVTAQGDRLTDLHHDVAADGQQFRQDVEERQAASVRWAERAVLAG